MKKVAYILSILICVLLLGMLACDNESSPTGPTLPPDPVTLTTVDVKSGATVRVSWEASPVQSLQTSPAFRGYNVYFGDSESVSTETGTLAYGCPYLYSPAEFQITPAGTYYVMVTVINDAGESDPSNVISAVMTGE